MKVAALILVAGFKVRPLLFSISLLGLFGASCVTQSCVTQKACFSKFPPDTITVVNTVYRDTIIQVPVLGTDTVYKYGTIRDTVYASAGTAHSISYVTQDTLKLFVWQSDTTLLVRLDSAIRELQIKDTEIYTIQAKCDKSKTERVIDKLIAFVVIVFGGWLVINLIKLFK